MTFINQTNSEKKKARRRKDPWHYLAVIYANQKSREITRFHGEPQYTLEELRARFENDYEFITLFNQWVESGYAKQLAPSLDRVDNSKGYTLDNLEVVTWEENNRRGAEARSTSVIAIKGDERTPYPSIKAAAKGTGARAPNIGKVLRGERNTAAGYKFMFN